jgi:hypothetical protein
MRKLGILAACLIGIFCCLATSPVLASCTVSQGCAYGPPISCTNYSSSGGCSSGSDSYGGWVKCGTGYADKQYCPPVPVEGEPYCEDPRVQACDDEWDCTAYCESIFTGTWLQVECGFNGCCECIDIG